MRYLHYDFYKNTCESDDEIYQNIWHQQQLLWRAEFDKISSRLPKRFYKEYCKTEFHDVVINQFSVKRVKSSSRYKYCIELELEHPSKQVVYNCRFDDVRNIRSEIKDNNFSGICDWLYAEIIGVDEKYMALEAVLVVDSFLYFEFKSMTFKKMENRA